MKIAHFIPSIDISTGGPARSVTHLIKSLLKNSKFKIDLFTSSSSNPIIEEFNTENGQVYFSQEKKVKEDLKRKSSNYKLFHGHGIWEAPVHKMSKLARKHKIPYIITPRGMLEPWSLAQGKLKKQIALKLYQSKDLKKAACIHATAKMEAESIRNLGYKNPIAVIPNGINIIDFVKDVPKKNTEKTILFLSRIHPKKGIENLIEAWGSIKEENRKEWKVKIVGNGEKTYINSLQSKIESKNLNNCISIELPVFGKKKIDLYRNVNLFVLPTFSENFGIVIAEALASYTPVITTKGTPWEDLKDHKCGWWIDIGVAPLKEALIEAISKSDEELGEMGKNGRMLIENKYSMHSVALNMIKLYNWIVDNKEKPDFIQ